METKKYQFLYDLKDFCKYIILPIVVIVVIIGVIKVRSNRYPSDNIFVVKSDNLVDVSNLSEVRNFLTSNQFRNENMSIKFYPEKYYELKKDYETVLTGSWRIGEKIYESSIMVYLESSRGTLSFMLSGDGKIMDKASSRIFISGSNIAQTPISGTSNSTEISSETLPQNQDNTNPAETANYPNQYDKETVEREIKLIKRRFYSLNYGKLRVDSITRNEHFNDDLTIIYTDSEDQVVKISSIMEGANIRSNTDYYYEDNILYFIYSYTNGTVTTKPFESRAYIYNNDVIKIIENGNVIECTKNCDFSPQSEPYRLLRYFYGLRN